MEGAFAGDGVVGEGRAGREMLAGVDEAELGFGQVGAEGEKRAQRCDGCREWDGDGEGCEMLARAAT